MERWGIGSWVCLDGIDDLGISRQGVNPMWGGEQVGIETLRCLKGSIHPRLGQDLVGRGMPYAGSRGSMPAPGFAAAFKS